MKLPYAIAAALSSFSLIATACSGGSVVPTLPTPVIPNYNIAAVHVGTLNFYRGKFTHSAAIFLAKNGANAFFLIDTDNSCALEELVKTAERSIATRREMSFKALDNGDGYLELAEDCPRINFFH